MTSRKDGSIENDIERTAGRSPDESESSTLGNVPARVGPFRVTRALGYGAMGEVYLAEQEHPRRHVAVKVVQLGLHTQENLRRFREEASPLAMMSHEYIARVYEVGGTIEKHPYLAMEYVDGTPLEEFCDARRISVRERLELFRKICDGVQHAHQKAIIHRDLKPSNILIVVQDDVPLPKIIDFGLARPLGGSREDRGNATGAAETCVGTPLYMSPEQKAGLRDVGTRTDVYSLGVILHALLGGQPAFDAGAVDREERRPSDHIRDRRCDRPRGCGSASNHRAGSEADAARRPRSDRSDVLAQ